MTTSSARPDDLRRFERDALRAESAIATAERLVRHALAAFEGSSPDGGPVDVPLRTVTADRAALRSLAQRVGMIGDAFQRADRGDGRDVVRLTDERLARLVIEHHPRVANALVVAALVPELARRLGDRLRERAEADGSRIDDLRTSVPRALLSDPTFCRQVLARLGPDRLIVLAQDLAAGQTVASPTPDLRWLADLFAAGAGTAAGGPTPTTEELLTTAAGRNAVRVLRASSARRLAPATVERLALSVAVLHPASRDGTVAYLAGPDGLDIGDRSLLLEAASLPGVAVRILTGPLAGGPRDPIGRVRDLIADSAAVSQEGLVALLAAALDSPGLRDGEALTASGLAFTTGLVEGIAAVPVDDWREGDLSGDLAVLAGTVLARWSDLLVPVPGRGDADGGADGRDQLAQAVVRLADDRIAFDTLVAALAAGRRQAYAAALRGDPFPLEATGRFQAVLEEGAATADVPRRPLDGAVGLAAGALDLVAARKLPPALARIATDVIERGRSSVSDAVAEAPGTAAERLRQVTASSRDLVLAIVDDPTLGPLVVWAGTGVAHRGQLARLGEGELDQRVRDQWLARQPLAVRTAARAAVDRYERARREG